MKKIKRLFVKMLFSKKQREIIQQAVIFSEYTYRRRGRVDEAAKVQCVLNEITPVIGIIKQTFTKEEVDAIVDNFSKSQTEIFKREIKKAFEAGADSVLKHLKPVGCLCVKKVEENDGKGDGNDNKEEETKKGGEETTATTESAEEATQEEGEETTTEETAATEEK